MSYSALLLAALFFLVTLVLVLFSRCRFKSCSQEYSNDVTPSGLDIAHVSSVFKPVTVVQLAGIGNSEPDNVSPPALDGESPEPSITQLGNPVPAHWAEKTSASSGSAN